MLDSRSWFTFCNFINGLTNTLNSSIPDAFTPISAPTDNSFFATIVEVCSQCGDDNIRLGSNRKLYWRNHSLAKGIFNIPYAKPGSIFNGNQHARVWKLTKLKYVPKIALGVSVGVYAGNISNAIQHNNGEWGYNLYKLAKWLVA